MLNIETANSWLTLFIEKLEKNEDYLNSLDGPTGDGDHGSNMLRGAKDLKAKLVEVLPDTLTELFKIAGMSFIQKTGGTAGLLYGQAFLHMSHALVEENDLLKGLAEGLKGIQKYGHAELNEKTLVDVWIPVMEDIRNHRLTFEGINEYVLRTKDLRAKKGRAVYVADLLNGHTDPGAVSCGLFFEALLEAGVYDG